MRKTILKTLVVVSVAVTSSFAANLVSNPDFQSGTLSPWTYNSDVQYPWAVTTPGAADTGCIGAACVDNTNLASASYLYQNLNTHAGSTYQLSFDYATGGYPSALRVLWGGNIVLDLVDASTQVTSYFVSNLHADSDSMRLMFLAREDPDFNRLTNISVEESTSAAPEPAAMGLLMGGLGAIAALRYRRKSSVR